MLAQLQEFFTADVVDKYLRPLVNRNNASTDRTQISLRTLDFLVTNFAPKNIALCTYMIGERKFSIFHSYNSNLQLYHKSSFDPFQRGNVRVAVPNEGGVVSTICQLNFLRWAIENGVIEFATRNIELIRQAKFECSKRRAQMAQPRKKSRQAKADVAEVYERGAEHQCA